MWEKIRFKERVNEYLLNRTLKRIVNSSLGKTESTKNSVVLVSQVHHKAIELSIIALKSFTYYVEYAEIHIIDDGSLTKADHQLLVKNFENITIIDISTIDTTPCPRGGTWERLVYISRLSKTNYVIQVDSDVLTISPVFEVNEAIKKNISFTISDGPIWNSPVPTKLMSKLSKNKSSNHIQVKSERVLDKLDGEYISNYIRGCSGFCGFAKNSNLEELIIGVSTKMSSFLGQEEWSKWGTEQVTSNIAISSFEDSIILPWPKYQNFGFPFYSKNHTDYIGKTSLIHFIGTNRHKSNLYRVMINRFIESFNKTN